MKNLIFYVAFDPYPFTVTVIQGSVPSAERMLRIETIAKLPEQIYAEQETLRELDRIGGRDQAYLLYRHSFTDNIEYTMIETAIHFNLKESRAQKIEENSMDNLWLGLPWWF